MSEDTQVIVEDNEIETLLDLDTLNDMSVEGIEAAPEFLNEPPTGLYNLSVSGKVEKRKNKEGKQSLIIRYIYHVEDPAPVLENKNELVPAKGSMISETFQWNDDGKKYWKSRSISILGELGQATVGQVIKAINEDAGIVRAKVGTRKSEADGKTYYNAQIQVIKKA
jgi:hypothetical protein